jgi:hypothetical protein
VGAAIEAKVSNNTGCSNTALRNFLHHTLRSCGGSLKVDRLVTFGVIDMRGTARFISLCNSIKKVRVCALPLLIRRRPQRFSRQDKIFGNFLQPSNEISIT